MDRIGLSLVLKELMNKHLSLEFYEEQIEQKFLFSYLFNSLSEIMSIILFSVFLKHTVINPSHSISRA